MQSTRTSRTSAMRALHTLALLCAILGAAPLSCGATPAAPLLFTQGKPEDPGVPILAVEAAFPGSQGVSFLSSTSQWANVGSLVFDIAWPVDGPTNAQVMLYVSDWDYLWYQRVVPAFLEPGETNRISVNLRPDSTDWEASGHYSSWNLRAMMKPRQFGVRVFADEPFKGTFALQNGALATRQEKGPPAIRSVRANADTLACYEKFEVVFELPERHINPFDPDEIDVTVTFKPPSGGPIQVNAFYMRSFYREGTPSGERFVPQGKPLWCARFTPTVPGAYTYAITARDQWGEAHWGPGVLTGTTAKAPGFVRVSKKDSRFFEFSNGAPYHPVGHNARSPFDARMDAAFPWQQRWPKSTAVYEHYLTQMAAAGENWTEVWMAAWSLGLEWSEGYPWHHGIGQYNMRHAWELDRVLTMAEQRNIYVNIVIHNHGKFSTYWDPEWPENPFNIKKGGYLKTPEEYFTDARAVRAFQNLMRYTIARWGYSPNVFAWQLWSELDLVGTQAGWTAMANAYYGRQEAVDWHQKMGAAVKRMDPFNHMVSTHVCNDYSRQNPKITALPEMDLSCVDAYYYTPTPISIIALLQNTAANGSTFGKPILATEFGGSPHAAPLSHLRDSLHAGLWSSVAFALGGSPMFWWWQIVDEENLYREFAALSRYMQDEDRRDPNLQTAALQVLEASQATTRFAAVILKSKTRGYGWVYDVKGFNGVRREVADPSDDLSVGIPGLEADTAFDVEFWDTDLGAVIKRARATATAAGTLTLPFPPFRRDIAFKLRAAETAAK